MCCEWVRESLLLTTLAQKVKRRATGRCRCRQSPIRRYGKSERRTVAKTQTLAERRREAIRPSMPAPRTKRLAGSGVVTTDPT